MNLCIKYCENDEILEYSEKLENTGIDNILLSDLLYIVVENEQLQKLYIFGIWGKIKIYQNDPNNVPRSISLKSGSSISVIPCDNNTCVFIERPIHIYMMLNIIKKNASKKPSIIRKKIDRYCRSNDIRNRIYDYRFCYE